MSWADLVAGTRAAVFNTFAVDAIYNGGDTIPVIFDHQYVESIPSQDGFAQQRPVALIKNADAPSLAAGHTLVVDGVTYTVRSLEPNDDGTTLAVLRT